MARRGIGLLALLEAMRANEALGHPRRHRALEISRQRLSAADDGCCAEHRRDEQRLDGPAEEIPESGSLQPLRPPLAGERRQAPTAQEVRKVDGRHLEELVAAIALEGDARTDGAASARQRAVPYLERMRERLIAHRGPLCRHVQQRNSRDVEPVYRNVPVAGRGLDDLILPPRIPDRIADRDGTQVRPRLLGTHHLLPDAKDSGGVPAAAEPDARRTGAVRTLAYGVCDQGMKLFRRRIEGNSTARLELRRLPVPPRARRRLTLPGKAESSRQRADCGSAGPGCVRKEARDTFTQCRDVDPVGAPGVGQYAA